MKKITVIQPGKGFSFINLTDLIRFKPLLWNLILRDIKIRYKQTLIGGLWAILQPFLSMVVFSFFFGKLAKIPSEGVPYPIFSYSGLILWSYFTNSLNAASNSIINNANFIKKIFFPRLILLLAATLKESLSYFCSVLIIFAFMFYYQFTPKAIILLLPLVLVLTWLLTLGLGCWLAAINVRYRDVKHVLPFFIQLWLFITPVIYPASVAGRFEWLVSLNPMSGLIEAHRAMILGHQLVNWQLLFFSTLLTLIILLTGIFYFKHEEKKFADII